MIGRRFDDISDEDLDDVFWEKPIDERLKETVAACFAENYGEPEIQQLVDALLPLVGVFVRHCIAMDREGE